MDHAEQKKYTTRLKVVEAGALAVADEVVRLTDNLRADVTSVRETLARVEKNLGDERTHRIRLTTEQRQYVDNADRITDFRLAAFVTRGFWSRLNWLVTGR